MGIYIVCNRWVYTYDLKYNQWPKLLETGNNLPSLQVPSEQVCDDKHSSFSPHLHTIPYSHTAVHVSDTPAHLAFVPQWQILDMQVSDEFDEPEQSPSVMHSDVIGIW